MLYKFRVELFVLFFGVLFIFVIIFIFMVGFNVDVNVILVLSEWIVVLILSIFFCGKRSNKILM